MIKTLPAMKCVDRVWCSLKKRFIMSDNYIIFYKNYRYLTGGYGFYVVVILTGCVTLMLLSTRKIFTKSVIHKGTHLNN